MLSSIENGLGFEKPKRNYGKRLKRFIFGLSEKLIRVFLQLAVILAVFLVIVTSVTMYRMHHVAKSIESSWDDRVICTSPKHEGYERYDVVVMNGTSMFWPHILERSGKMTEVYERSKLCDQETSAVLSQRYENVYVGYREAPYDIFTRRSIFMGNSSVCIQHMVDYFENKMPCGPRRNRTAIRDEL